MGENTGVPYFPLNESRARYLSSTNLWEDGSPTIDFEDRPGCLGGWPITRQTSTVLPPRKPVISDLMSTICTSATSGITLPEVITVADHPPTLAFLRL